MKKATLVLAAIGVLTATGATAQEPAPLSSVVVTIGAESR